MQMMQMTSANVETVRPVLSLRRCFGISWPLLLGSTGFVALVLWGWGLGSPDVYLHVTAGRWIIEQGHVPLRDPFSFTRHGALWIAQEWGADLLMAGAFRVAGWSGLVLLEAACFGASLAYLMRFLLERMEPLHALLLAFVAAFMMLQYFVDCPSVLVWPLTAVWIGTLTRCSEERRTPPWWLLLVMLLWVNMHASFILGVGFAVLTAVESCINARQARWECGRRWALFVLSALGCAFGNPQGYRLLLYPFHLLDSKALGLILAWQSPSFLHPQALGLWILLIMALAFAGRVRLSLVRSVLVLGLMYMALEHLRNLALLGLISPFVLARPMAELWARKPLATLWAGRPASGRDVAFLDRLFGGLASRASLATVCVTLLLAGAVAMADLNAKRPAPPTSFTPRAALDALLSRGPAGRIFNDFNFGEYLIYRGVPVFVDARVGMYGNAFIERAIRAMALAKGSNLEALLVKYRIDAILLSSSRPAVKLLDQLPGWKRVYGDAVAVAYVRSRKHAA